MVIAKIDSCYHHQKQNHPQFNNKIYVIWRINNNKKMWMMMNDIKNRIIILLSTTTISKKKMEQNQKQVCKFDDAHRG